MLLNFGPSTIHLGWVNSGRNNCGFPWFSCIGDVIASATSCGYISAAKEVCGQLWLELQCLGYGQLCCQLSTRPGWWFVKQQDGCKLLGFRRFPRIWYLNIFDRWLNVYIKKLSVDHISSTGTIMLLLDVLFRTPCRSTPGVAQTGAMLTKNAQVPLHP